MGGFCDCYIDGVFELRILRVKEISIVNAELWRGAAEASSRLSLRKSDGGIKSDCAEEF